MVGLFQNLSEYPPSLPSDELALLAELPWYGAEQCVTAVSDEQHAACRRLERRGLVKVHREKDDDLAMRPTWYAGKLAAAGVREA